MLENIANYYFVLPLFSLLLIQQVCRWLLLILERKKNVRLKCKVAYWATSIVLGAILIHLIRKSYFFPIDSPYQDIPIPMIISVFFTLFIIIWSAVLFDERK